MTDQTKTINYTNIDFDALKNDILKDLSEKEVFKDANFQGSNVNNIVDIMAYVGAMESYYINSAVNESFRTTAKRYNNLNKLGQNIGYNARGLVSAMVNVVGNLKPEYIYGKTGEYIEIPAYSIFPSTKPTSDNKNFIFTNTLPAIHIVKGYGIRKLEQSDIRYKGYTLPIVAPKTFFSDISGQNAIINTDYLELELNLNKPLSVVERNSADNYRKFDTTHYPLENPADSSSVGQPFINNIECLPFSGMITGNEYPILLKYDISTSTPYLEIVTNPTILTNRQDDIIGKLVLELIDSQLNEYKLSIKELSTDKRFYVGRTGLDNLQSVEISYDTIPGKGNSVQQLHLTINKDGTKQPLTTLINGEFYSFSNGVISSPKFKEDYFDSNIDYYNVNLVINDTSKSELNYLASLDVTTKEPTLNQITIGRIYTKNVDSTGVKSLTTKPGSKYGNLTVTEKVTYKTSNQKYGKVFIKKGQFTQQVIFNDVFVPNENETTVKYQVQLSTDNNVRKWTSDQQLGGFKINIEPGIDFEGYVDWVATQIVINKTKTVPVTFNKPLTKVTTIDGLQSNYMVQLTANDNIEVWYDNLTDEGFDIKTEKEFDGKVSWSVYNFFDSQSTSYDVESTYRQSNKITIPANVDEINVELDIPFDDDTYAIQLVPNKNINVWYLNKQNNGFTIKKESGIDVEVVVDWYVDGSTEYKFQRHGEVTFGGRTVVSRQVPGFRYVDVPESFIINDLIQGAVGFTYINTNNIVDERSNFLGISLDSSKSRENGLSYIIGNTNISTNSIRVFVKNTQGKWDEFSQIGDGLDISEHVGNKVFKVYVNHDKLTKIEFGDGINWGIDTNNKEMFIIGLDSVGKEGNIGKNVLANQLVISQYILGNDKTDIEFEKSLVSVIGLKSKVYFDNGSVSTSIIDSENTRLSNNDLIITQNEIATGGANIESVDEIRSNISNSFIRQNRNVSYNDTEYYVTKVFSDYILKCKSLNYDELKQENIISQQELSKYWFNHVFIIALNKDGSNIIPKSLRDSIISKLDSSNVKMIGKQHEVLPASWIPIDVCIKYTKEKTANASSIETEMKKNLIDYFNYNNHELGTKISHSDMITLVKVDGVKDVEVMINKDSDNKFNANDYVVDIVGNVSDDVKKNKLMELVRKDPSLVKIFQPLFNTSSNGITEWNYSLDIILSKYEFPKLGDIVIKRNDQ